MQKFKKLVLLVMQMHEEIRPLSDQLPGFD